MVPPVDCGSAWIRARYPGVLGEGDFRQRLLRAVVAHCWTKRRSASAVARVSALFDASDGETINLAGYHEGAALAMPFAEVLPPVPVARPVQVNDLTRKARDL